MGHAGRPSGACRTCKQRHIKCDETRPSCRCCTRTNRICPGYAEGLDLVLRDQNESAKSSVQRARQRKKTPLAVIQSTGSSSSSQSPPAPTSYDFISRFLSPSEEQLSVCLFVDSWVIGPYGYATSTGIFEVIPALYASASPSSPLPLCLNAIASVLYGKLVRQQKAVETPETTSSLVSAINATRRALADPQESLTDETLTAVCLLGIYDGCVASLKGGMSSTKHFDGAATLIQHRQQKQQQQPESPAMRSLLLGLRREIITIALANTLSIDDTTPLFQICASLPQPPSAVMDSLCIPAANFLAKANNLSRCAPDRAASLLQEAHEVDALLASWPSLLPLDWQPVPVELKDLPTPVINSGLYRGSCEVYPDVLICGTWNEWRVARLCVLALISRLIPLLPSSSSTVALKAQNTAAIQSVVDAICSTVPFVLGSRCSPVPIYATGEACYPPLASGAPVPESHHRAATAWGGWILLGPLKKAMSVGMWLRPGQLAWMGQQLMRLGAVYAVNPDDDVAEGERRWRAAARHQPPLPDDEIEMHWRKEIEEGRIVEAE